MNIDVMVILVIALGLVMFVGDPLLRRSTAGMVSYAPSSEVERLALQKDMLYTAIRDVDFDFQTGKMETRDYQQLRQQLEGEAAQILRQLDVLDPLLALDQAIEQQVTALRAQSTPLQEAVASRICLYCTARVHVHDNFCSACGLSLKSA